MRLVIVGNEGGTNVGESFRRAAESIGFRIYFCNAKFAFDAAFLVSVINWKLLRHRPPYLNQFSQLVLQICNNVRPDILLTTGISPITDKDLCSIGQLGIQRINYLTDDPWNPAFCSQWFFHALQHYDVIFSMRKSNLLDLQAFKKSSVFYIPFGFDPAIFYPQPFKDANDSTSLSSDVMFVGGADKSRVPYIASLIQSGFHVALYGDYWNRFPETRDCSRGHADPAILRQATAETKVSLCLVRRANRDGHVMRSFEIPAMGGCMLTEDTPEHREIFGVEGEAVVYFQTIDEMIARLRWLLDHPDERQRLATAAHRLITGGQHTYRDRLITMLEHASTLSSQSRQPV